MDGRQLAGLDSIQPRTKNSQIKTGKVFSEYRSLRLFSVGSNPNSVYVFVLLRPRATSVMRKRENREGSRTGQIYKEKKSRDKLVECGPLVLSGG
jgi:hypothetical protein